MNMPRFTESRELADLLRGAEMLPEIEVYEIEFEILTDADYNVSERLDELDAYAR
jgi:hypothetical protein